MEILGTLWGKLSGHFLDKKIKQKENEVFLQKCYEVAYKTVGEICGQSTQDLVRNYISTPSIQEKITKAFEHVEPNLSIETFDSRDLQDEVLKHGLDMFTRTFMQEMKKNHELSDTVAHKQQEVLLQDLTKNMEKVKVSIDALERNSALSKHNVDLSVHIQKGISEHSILDKFNIPYKVNKIIEISGEDNEVKVHFMVKHKEDLKKFKSIEEIVQYAYVNQTNIILEVINFTMIVDNQPIITNINSLYTGQTLSFALYNQGTCRIAEKFMNSNINGNIISNLEIIPPKPQVMTVVDIYDNDMEYAINNIKLSLYKSGYVSENIIRQVYCNLGEENVFTVSLCVDVIISPYKALEELPNLTNVKLDIKAQNLDKVDNLLEWLKFLKASKKGKMTMKTSKERQFLAEGLFKSEDSLENLEDEYKLLKKLQYIERKMDKQFVLSALDEEEIKVIEGTYNALKTGILRTDNLTIKIPHDKTSKLDVESIGNKVQYIADFKGITCNILNETITLGNGLLIQQEAVIKEVDDEQTVLSSIKSEKNFLVLYDYYPEKSREEVLKIQGIEYMSGQVNTSCDV
ncbi:MAG: hypothetical protein ACRC1P_03945 [Cellulosilyticaceae bacterium]